MAEPRILLLSFQHRDTLATSLAEAGWQVESARRAKDFGARIDRSNPDVILIDARGAGDEALALLRSLEQRAVPVIVIAERRKAALLNAAADAGASWVLGAPFAQAELDVAIRLAAGPRGQSVKPVKGKSARDALTGLGNANLAKKWIAENLPHEPVSVLLITLTRFDMINSAFGSEAGDAVLRAAAQRIEPLVAENKSGALLVRMAGTEFAVILIGATTPARLQLLAQAITDTLERPISVGDQMIRLGCRIGIVQSVARDRSAAALLRRASDALAEAGLPDQPPIHFMSDSDADMAGFAASLHADLRTALMRDEIDILFQPQVTISDGRVTGVEALARWHHPRHGEIGAATLFAVAEQSDYLVELSRHVQRRAIDMAMAWPASLAHLRLSINVTSADMTRTAFVRTLLGFLTKAGFPAARLTVEVTESGIMHNLAGAAATLNRLRAAGCRVAIDDFGTGYSSLAWLKELPADYLKLDKGLAGDMIASPKGQMVVSGIIALARSLGLSVIAEGVETQAHLDQLRDQGCALYQGYLCSPPVTTEKLLPLV